MSHHREVDSKGETLGSDDDSDGNHSGGCTLGSVYRWLDGYVVRGKTGNTRSDLTSSFSISNLYPLSPPGFVEY